MEKVKMLGALVGDIIGSVYEFRNTKSTDFELFPKGSRFTDDSVMTLAVAKWQTVLLIPTSSRTFLIKKGSNPKVAALLSISG